MRSAYPLSTAALTVEFLDFGIDAGPTGSPLPAAVRISDGQGRSRVYPLNRVQGTKQRQQKVLVLGDMVDLKLIGWCRVCSCQTDARPAEQIARYGIDFPVTEWRTRILCSRCEANG